MSWGPYSKAAAPARPRPDYQAPAPANDNKIGPVKARPRRPLTMPIGKIPKTAPITLPFRAFGAAALAAPFAEIVIKRYLDAQNKPGEQTVNTAGWYRDPEHCPGSGSLFLWGKTFGRCSGQTLIESSKDHYEQNLNVALNPTNPGTTFIGEWSDIYYLTTTSSGRNYYRGVCHANWRAYDITANDPFFVQAPAARLLPSPSIMPELQFPGPFGKCGSEPSSMPLRLPPMPTPFFDPGPDANALQRPSTAAQARPGKAPKAYPSANNGGSSGGRPSKPKKGEKEKKAQLGKGGQAVWGALNSATEAIDLINALHDALPDDKQADDPRDIAEKAQKIFDHFEELDIEQAIENLINEQIEDLVYGKVFGTPVKAANQMGGMATGGSVIGKPIEEPLPLPTIDLDLKTCSINLIW